MRRITVVLLFLATSLVFVSPGLWPGNAYGPTDILTLGAPYRDARPLPPDLGNPVQNDQVEQLPFVIEFWTAARTGEFQLWEPDLGGGVPLFTTVYNRVLAPWNIAFLVVPVAKAAAIAMMLAFFVAQLGTYGLARRLGSSVPGASLAAVVYAFSGPSVVFMLRIHEVFLFPVVLYALHAAVTETDRRPGFLALLSVSFAFLLMGGFPAAALTSAYLAGGWLLYLAISTGTARSVTARLWGAARRASRPVGAIAAGVAVASVQLLPSYEFLASSEALDRTYPLHHRVGLEQLATAVSGRFFGAYQFGDRWAKDLVDNPVEGSLAVGGIALLLVALLVVRPASRAVGGEMASALRRFFVPVALGVTITVYFGGLLLGVVHTLPFMEANNFGRARFFVALAIALAAGHSLDRLITLASSARETGGDPVLRFQLAALLGLIGLGTYEGFTFAFRADAVGQVVMALVVPIVAGATAWGLLRVVRRDRGDVRRMAALGIAVLAAAELQWGGWNFTPASPVETFYQRPPALDRIANDVGSSTTSPSFRFLGIPHETLRPNAAAVWDVMDVRAAWPTYGRFRDLLRIADPDVYEAKRLKPHFTDAFHPASPALDAMSARYLVTTLNTPLIEAETEPVVAALGPDGASLSLNEPIQGPVRGISLRLDDVGSCDPDGHFVLEAAGTTTRRIVRDRAEWTTFALPDVGLQVGSEIHLSAPSCPVRIVDDEVRIHTATADAATTVISVEGWVLYERASAMPRVALAERIALVPDLQERLDLISARSSGSPTVVEEAVDVPPDPQGGATIVDAGPDRITIRADSDRPAMLVLRDVAAPGWTVSVNGEATEVLTVDHAFRGVVVPLGESEVTFTYAPRALKLGALLMVVGVLAILYWAWAWATRRGGRDRTGGSGSES